MLKFLVLFAYWGRKKNRPLHGCFNRGLCSTKDLKRTTGHLSPPRNNVHLLLSWKTCIHSFKCLNSVAIMVATVFVLYFLLNPFAPEPPVLIHVISTPCDVISFNGQGQLFPLTCAEWRDLSNHMRMSTIQSRTPEKKAKNHVRLTWKSAWKSCSIAHLPFLSPNPKILKAFPKTLPTKMKPTKCPAREKKNEARKAKKEGRRESENLKILLSAHARTSQAEIRRPWSARSVNGFVVCFSSY